MVKKMLDKAVELTKECWRRYWQLDLDFMLDHCADDVTWVGAVQSEFMQGKDQMREDFEQLKKELKPCHLLCQEYIVMNNSGSICTVIGRYLVTTDDNVEYFLQAQQRCTFIWAKNGESLEIKHIHVSNPIGEMKIAENEIFVNEMGKMAGEYMKRHIDALNDTTKIVGTSPDGHLHFINRSEIIYACALNKYCEIHTINGKIDLKMQISEFLKLAGDGFAAVHRSYVVNKSYIKEIRPYDVVMIDGSAVPIPMRKFSQIRDMLINSHMG
ncbi:MAG: LytTR family transcriptional regulator DNA-binding domain-containing protein [Oscillospiraceae bacterium]|nr:LytTR family transcriptional regulator DNA-binding domain-containing protein [Oscillospiraceae bacterium]